MARSVFFENVFENFFVVEVFGDDDFEDALVTVWFEDVGVAEEENRDDGDGGDNDGKEDVTHAEREPNHHGEEDAEQIFGATLNGTKADKREGTENCDRGAEIAINHNHDSHDK